MRIAWATVGAIIQRVGGDRGLFDMVFDTHIAHCLSGE